jgi:hypothetical protein
VSEGGVPQTNPWKRALRSLVSIVLFALVVAILFYSWQLAWLVTAGLAFHELGHVLVIWALGIEWEIGFSGIGAWTRTPLEARQRLNHFWNSVIHLAGPVFSLLLAVVAVLIHVVALPAEDYWLRLANFNALLVVLNLLPLGELSDGGKLVRRLFASVPEKLEERMLYVVGLVPLLFVMVVLSVNLRWHVVLAMLVVVVWFVINVMVARRQDNPAEAGSSRAMSGEHAFRLLIAALGAFIGGIIVILITPLWLTRQHALDLVGGFLGLGNYVVNRSPPAFQVLFGLTLAAIATIAGRNLLAELRRRRSQVEEETRDSH